MHGHAEGAAYGGVWGVGVWIYRLSGLGCWVAGGLEGGLEGVVVGVAGLDGAGGSEEKHAEDGEEAHPERMGLSAVAGFGSGWLLVHPLSACHQSFIFYEWGAGW